MDKWLKIAIGVTWLYIASSAIGVKADHNPAKEMASTDMAYKMGEGMAEYINTTGRVSCHTANLDTAYERMILCIQFIDSTMDPNVWRWMSVYMEQGYLNYIEAICQVNCKDQEYSL